MRQRPSLRTALSTTLFIGFALSATAAEWARFRGPDGNGIAADRDVPVKWTTTDGVLWKTPIDGVGNSSPIVCGGRVFLQTSSPSGSERALACYDATTGKLLWSKSIPANKAHIHPRNTLASGTPASDGERVYLAAWDGQDIQVHAFDFSGNHMWQTNLGKFVSQHGAGHSPIVYAGKVYLANDQDGSAVLVALDAATGRALWKSQRKPFRACYSTPFIRSTPQGPELVVASTAGVSAYDPATGALNWNCDWPFAGRPLRTVASPIAGSGLIFANAGDGDGSRDMIALHPGDKKTGKSGKLAWQERKSFPYVPCMLSLGDLLFTVNDKGIAACTEAQTGKPIWSERLASAVTASPVLIDGKVYAPAEDGNVYVFSATTKFKLLARNPVGEPLIASPAVADGRLYLRGSNTLYCIGKTFVK
jgi:outer membrane protein assembly factor BamB